MAKISEVWGVTAASTHAARMLGDKSHHVQVRAVVRARSRAAAARYLAAAELFYNAGEANRHLTTYGSTTRNVRELAVCDEEGEVFVTSMNGGDGLYLRWPPRLV